ncbi:MAG: UDP-glucose 4-epimerase GalE [Alphaproteobacteria bacterium]|nr:MAG: UDP-glucose 4-epimerase GalE [Alphaproteobacteria bacterium]
MASRQTILVTGGAGYIGSHACKALAAAGHLPVTYDSLVLGHERAVAWGPLERGDITDRPRLAAVLARHRPAAVMHFAALSDVAQSMADPGRYYANNVGGTLCLLEAMRDHGVDRIVLSSTASVYGVPATVPVGEDAPLAPINPYGASKAMAERLIADFAAAHGLGWMALRYFNAAGADPDGETGEDHDPETHLIPLVLAAAAGRRGAVTVNGDDYDTPDGTCIRDYVHVSDLADAHVLALEALLAGSGSAVCNLGNGAGFSVRQVIAAAERTTGRKVPVITGPRRPGDPAVLVADAGRARRLLGWAPRLSDLETIIATAWRWHGRPDAARPRATARR